MNFCLNCSTELGNRSKKYCSNKCQKEYEYKNFITKWKKGEVSGMRGKYQLSMHIRKYIFEKYDNKCSICGWSKINPYTGLLPLEIEHKDGNFENNSEDNLILLCPNCHSLTSTYKGANVNHGRTARKKYSTY
ncbi:MAG: HNH endonuclease [Clostridia bacterium]|nr:HNH endonuclease [Clostridia bacterium]